MICDIHHIPLKEGGEWGHYWTYCPVCTDVKYRKLHEEYERTRPRRIVSYGGGTNSTAMIIGLWEKGERPDAIIFADTGGEKPHTYDFIKLFSFWCTEHGFPEIVSIKGGQPQQIKDGSLESECLRLKTLPAKAFGLSSCSQKWKIEPFDTWLNQNNISACEKLIGFDVDEAHRMDRLMKFETPLKKFRFPLIKWGWGRDECKAAIGRVGLPQPGKSACFFCPSSKKWEIRDLATRYPDLMKRALEMEHRALTDDREFLAVKGLGRDFSWGQYLKQGYMFNESDAGIPDIDCGCLDG